MQGDQKSQETETNVNDRGIDEATFPLHQVRAHTLPARGQAASPPISLLPATCAPSALSPLLAQTPPPTRVSPSPASTPPFVPAPTWFRGPPCTAFPSRAPLRPTPPPLASAPAAPAPFSAPSGPRPRLSHPQLPRPLQRPPAATRPGRSVSRPTSRTAGSCLDEPGADWLRAEGSTRPPSRRPMGGGAGPQRAPEAAQRRGDVASPGLEQLPRSRRTDRLPCPPRHG